MRVPGISKSRHLLLDVSSPGSQASRSVPVSHCQRAENGGGTAGSRIVQSPWTPRNV
jgi:hypothetical protein